MSRLVVLASTGGSVYRAVARHSRLFRESVALVVSDRDCGAIEAAGEFGHRARVVPWEGREAFGGELLRLLVSERADACVSFFTRLLGGAVLNGYRGWLVNLHPSILPACPGRHGFEDTLRSGSRFVGSTLHLIDAGMDTGRPVIQACIPRDPRLSSRELRHRVFVQQCRSLIQFVHWLDQGRLARDACGEIRVAGAGWDAGEFSPNLDAAEAIGFDAACGREQRCQ